MCALCSQGSGSLTSTHVHLATFVVWVCFGLFFFWGGPVQGSKGATAVSEPHPHSLEGIAPMCPQLTSPNPLFCKLQATTNSSSQTGKATGQLSNLWEFPKIRDPSIVITLNSKILITRTQNQNKVPLIDPYGSLKRTPK